MSRMQQVRPQGRALSRDNCVWCSRRSWLYAELSMCGVAAATGSLQG